jgi:hypothetical protein
MAPEHRRYGELKSRDLRAAGFCSCCFLVSLPPGLIRRPELLFLLTQYFAAAIGPTRSLLTRLPGAITNKLATIFRAGAQRLTGFIPGTRSIKDAGDCPNAQACEKPN